ncbi:MAG TPA: cytochrome c biogenesis CcdA family protein [Gemmatimonadota bacterium]|nr:cytochrome c biogenesis CcdA family protein [Gemmatimonadota bacterium]
MTDIPLSVALLAGVASFLSPCVLPLVPGYLAFVTGVSITPRSSVDGAAPAPDGQPRPSAAALSTAAAFVLGFSIVFVLLGASATFAGRFLLRHGRAFGWLAGGLIVVMGLHVMGALRIPFLYRERRLHTRAPPETLAGSVAVGMAFGFGWTPCIGPVLAGILGLAATRETVTGGMGLLAVYSAGLGFPFLLAALAADSAARWIRRFGRAFRVVEVAAGLLLVGIGGLVLTGSMPWLAGRLTFLQGFVL